MKVKFHHTVQNTTYYKYRKLNMDNHLLADCASEFQSTLKV